jgi:asparagine synthase (glutamine-hydrolysing)
MGEKPLYYGWQGRGNRRVFLFGSELKALIAHPSFVPEVDRNALTGFMRFGYVSSPQSIYQNICKLIPGTLLTLAMCQTSTPLPVPYWSLFEVARQGIHAPFSGSDSEAITELGKRLSAAIHSQQISDVPIGAFLSGGVDSSTIVALMQTQSARPVHTFTIGFEEEQLNEAKDAALVAKHLGTDHRELYVTSNQAQAVIPRLPALYDEPFADSSQIPTFLVSQLAREKVAVSLSGDGGDELLGGYNRYTWTERILNVPTTIRRTAAMVLSALPPTELDRGYSLANTLLPKALHMRMFGDKAHKLASIMRINSSTAIYERLISSWMEAENLVLGGADISNIRQSWEALADLDSNEHRMMAIDSKTYLPDDILCKVDRAAMGVSLETRVPFLDHRVVEFAWRLPLAMKIRAGQGKWLLRQLLYKHVPKQLIERPKMGFGVPIDQWLRGPLCEWAEDLLNESRLRQEGFFNPAPIHQKWREHLSGRRNWAQPLWTVLMFQAWLRAQ